MNNLKQEINNNNNVDADTRAAFLNKIAEKEGVYGHYDGEWMNEDEVKTLEEIARLSRKIVRLAWDNVKNNLSPQTWFAPYEKRCFDWFKEFYSLKDESAVISVDDRKAFRNEHSCTMRRIFTLLVSFENLSDPERENVMSQLKVLVEDYIAAAKQNIKDKQGA